MKNKIETTKHEGVPDFYYVVQGIERSKQISIYHRGNNNPESQYQYPFYESLLTINQIKNSHITADGTEIRLTPTQEQPYKLQEMKTLQRQLLIIYFDEGMDALIEELKKMGAKEKIEERKIKFE